MAGLTGVVKIQFFLCLVSMAVLSSGAIPLFCPVCGPAGCINCCTVRQNPVPDSALILKTTEGKNFDFSEIKKSRLSVFIFLSPDCPLCQSYTHILGNIHQKYDSLGVAFYGVFPGTYYSRKSIRKFVKKNNLGFTMLLDPGYIFTKKMKAKITPEVFILHGEGSILYSGKIDNWPYDLGKKRAVITEHYLRDALDSALQGKEVIIKKTDAIGCFIFADQASE